MRNCVLVLLLGLVLASVTASGDTMVHPHLILQGGATAGLIPVFDTSIYLSGTYAVDGFEGRARTSLTVVPGFSVYQEAGFSFFPGEMTIGMDVNLSVIPFVLAAADVWAETAIVESYIGETDARFIGIAGADLWLGRMFGGEFFFRAIAESPEEGDWSVTSITSVAYDQMRGLGLEEELNARVRFFSGQLLTEDDLSSLVGYATARCRLERNGFALTGIVLGLELEVRKPLQQDSND